VYSHKIGGKNMFLKILFKFILGFVLGTSILFANERINLGKNINSECIELNPVISSDGNTLYFCRSNCEDNIGGDDIWVSKKDKNGNWTLAKNIGYPLNDQTNNFVSSISTDGNSLILGNVYRNRHKISQGLSLARRVEGGWSFPDNIEVENFYNYDESNSFWLSYSGNFLLMTIERDDSYGQKDIYVCEKIDDLTWSEPKNLGSVVNSKGDEITPYLAADGRTLYYSSNGFKTIGDMDVFMTRTLDDSWTNWSEPVNLGPGVNTENWDAYYKLSAKGDFAYYVTAVDGKNTDIFQVEVPEHIRPMSVALFSGQITSAKSYIPLHADITYRELETGKVLGTFSSSIVDGHYKFVFPMNHKYEIEINSTAYMPLKDTLDLLQFKDYIEIDQDYELIPRTDSLMLIKNILLPTGIADPTAEETEHLMNVARFLSESPNYYIEIIGHTDNIGKEESNLSLSIERAKSTGKLFESNGVKDDQLLVSGKGEAEPIASNDTEEGRSLNRRVEIYLIKK
jgi:outer membrane protein OmpA-like peptidoglycan-associated protein